VKNHNSRQLNLGTFFAKDGDETARYAEEAFRRTWAEGGAPDDEELLRGVARTLCWSPEAFLEFIASDEARERFARSTQDAIARGVFGVPTMMVHDQMWWGNDRLAFLEEHLAVAKRRGS